MAAVSNPGIAMTMIALPQNKAISLDNFPQNAKVHSKGTKIQLDKITSQLFPICRPLTVSSLDRIKAGVIQLIDNEIATSDESSSIERLSSGQLDEVLKDDKESMYSHYVTANNGMHGIVLARESQKSIYNTSANINIVFIEKLLIFQSARRLGLGKRLLHVIAQKALVRKQDEVRLLIFKTNKVGLDFYFRVGFEYADKEKDAPYDSFLLKTKISTLFAKTSVAPVHSILRDVTLPGTVSIMPFLKSLVIPYSDVVPKLAVLQTGTVANPKDPNSQFSKPAKAKNYIPEAAAAAVILEQDSPLFLPSSIFNIWFNVFSITKNLTEEFIGGA